MINQENRSSNAPLRGNLSPMLCRGSYSEEYHELIFIKEDKLKSLSPLSEVRSAEHEYVKDINYYYMFCEIIENIKLSI